MRLRALIERTGRRTCGSHPSPPPSSSASATATTRRGMCNLQQQQQQQQQHPQRGRPCHASSAASFPPHADSTTTSPTPTSAPAPPETIEQALAWRPRLSLPTEVLCALAAAAFTAAASMLPSLFSPPPAAALAPPGVVTLLRQAALTALTFILALCWIRNRFLERMFFVHARPEAQLGDPDSFFLPLAPGAGGPGTPAVQVHYKSALFGTPLRPASKADRLAPAPAPAAPPLGATAASLPALVHCYHGFGANLYSFEPVLRRLSSALPGGALVTSHDMPGFGLTSRPDPGVGYLLAFNGRLGRVVQDGEARRNGLVPDRSQPMQTGAPAKGGVSPSPSSKLLASSASSSDVSSASSVTLSSLGSTASLLTSSPSLGPSTGGNAGGALGASNSAALLSPAGNGEASTQDFQRLQEEGPGSGLHSSGDSGGSISSGASDPSSSGAFASGALMAAPRYRRVLVGHSMGGICAAQQALEDPLCEVDALVLVAPAVLVVGAASRLAGTALQELPLTPNLSTPPDSLRRFVPTSTTSPSQPASDTPPPPPPATAAPSPSLAACVAAVIRVALGLLVLLLLRVLRPALTTVLRMAVRSRGFWVQGLGQAWYDKDKLTDKAVDQYRLPQLVRGWERGMCLFLEARLAPVAVSDLWQGSGGAGASSYAGEPWAPQPMQAAEAGVFVEAEGGGGGGKDRQGRLREGFQSLQLADRLAVEIRRRNVVAAGGEAAAAPAQGPRPLRVLIVHGRQDALVPLSNSEYLARLLPPGCGCELVVVERCGHMPHEEHPELFAQLVADFVGRR